MPLLGVNFELLSAEEQEAQAASLQMRVDELILGARLQAEAESQQTPQDPAPSTPAITVPLPPWPVHLAGPAPPAGTLPASQRTNQDPEQTDNKADDPSGGELVDLHIKV